MTKKPIRGEKLRIVESAVQFNFELQDTNREITIVLKRLDELRRRKKELTKSRNDEVRRALKLGAPYKQIGDRLGISEIAIFYIKQEGDRNGR